MVSRLEYKNCTLWPCTLIAATMFLTWSLVLWQLQYIGRTIRIVSVSIYAKHVCVEIMKNKSFMN